ncbi:uncharacterized protein LOC116800902 [Drosophila sechellia]|uniref:uncharacterized protein LOC116800902 n=1 Tax=Drosophila sechellia TaxID=7238 RepID=UPI0013DDB278|nr:uncharacterized protein LOC116800902 [Drosophila sechellia]
MGCVDVSVAATFVNLFFIIDFVLLLRVFDLARMHDGVGMGGLPRSATRPDFGCCRLTIESRAIPTQASQAESFEGCLPELGAKSFARRSLRARAYGYGYVCVGIFGAWPGLMLLLLLLLLLQCCNAATTATTQSECTFKPKIRFKAARATDTAQTNDDDNGDVFTKTLV